MPTEAERRPGAGRWRRECGAAEGRGPPPLPCPPGRWRQHRAGSAEPGWTGAFDLPAGISSRLRSRLDGGPLPRDWLGAGHVGRRPPPTQTIEWSLSLGTWPSCAVVSPGPAGEGGAGAAPGLLGSRARADTRGVLAPRARVLRPAGSRRGTGPGCGLAPVVLPSVPGGPLAGQRSSAPAQASL